MECNYINTIRICIKARKYSFGETMLYDIKSHKVKLVVIANDIGESSKKKIIDKCNYYKVKYLILFDKEKMNSFFNKNISAFGITDKNLTLKFLNNLEGGCQDEK